MTPPQPVRPFLGRGPLCCFFVLLAWPLASPAAAAEVHPAVLAAEAERVSLIERLAESVVAIFEESGQGGGSGVLISPDGFALSNYHVVAPCGYAMKCGLADGNVYDAVLVGIDPTGDVALIRLLGRDDFPYAPLGDSSRVRVGEWVLAMGNPFLLATDFRPTVTYGIVSGVGRYQYPSGTLLEYTDCIQTDASINPGNSGGPLFSAAGELIGVNGRASFDERGRVNVGVAYAISINQVKNFLGHLHAGRIVDHATLGARVSSDAAGRPYVSDILEHSDAYRRGLRYGDEIVAFAGRPIDSPNAFQNVLGTLPKGWQVPLSFRRDGVRRNVLVRLAGVHGSRQLLELVDRGRPGPGPPPRPPDRPKPPGPPSEPPAEGEEAVPEIVRAHYDSRTGYANYHFNRVHQARVWEAFAAPGRWTADDGSWRLSANLIGHGPVEIHLGRHGARLSADPGIWEWSTDEVLSLSSPPPDSGGLLPALYLWRRLATEGLDGFGEIHYLGTAPLAGGDELHDVLVGLYSGVETHFYFAPADGRLAALVMFAATDADPCEVYFADYRPLAGRALPHRIVARYGDDDYGVFEIGEIEVVPPEDEGRNGRDAE